MFTDLPEGLNSFIWSSVCVCVYGCVHAYGHFVIKNGQMLECRCGMLCDPAVLLLLRSAPLLALWPTLNWNAFGSWQAVQRL